MSSLLAVVGNHVSTTGRSLDMEIELLYITCSQRILDAIMYFSVKYGSIYFNIYDLKEAKVRLRPFLTSSDIFVHLTSVTHAHGHLLELKSPATTLPLKIMCEHPFPAPSSVPHSITAETYHHR